MQKILTGLLLTLCVLSAAVQAGMYRYTDANGRVHYTDKPPPSVEARSVDADISVYQAPVIKPSTYQPLQRKSSKKVVMYSAAWCGVCAKAKRYMQDNAITYTEYDIDTSTRGKRDYKRLNGRGVPILLVGEQRMNGFDPGRLQAMLKAN